LPDVLNAHARSSAFVLASGALHLALSWAADEPAAVPRRTPLRALEEMEFEILAPVTQPEPSALASAALHQAPPAAVVRPQLHSAREAPRPERLPATPKLDPAPKLDPNPAPAPHLNANSAPSASSRRALDLSPQAAARTLSADLGATPSTFSLVLPNANDSDVDRAAEARLTKGIAGLTRQGEERIPLDDYAHGFTALVSKPWEVILRPLRRPRYHFHGAGFDAIIRADGSVQYRDKAGLHVAALQTAVVDGQPIEPSEAFGIGYRAGDGSHTSEQRAFLERTRPLRDLLHERYRRVALARADILLKAELARITISLDAGNDRGAHTRLFTLWDECAEDEVGAVARKRIEAFVREQCRPGSEHTFSPAELTAFNARRVSRQRFDPFAHDEDAAVTPSDTPDAG
jgi:hypothetical protein